MDILKIKGVVKNYAWGNKDFIPSLIGGFDGKPQAELWMGAHPSGDATLESGEKLSEYIKDNPDVVGKDKLEYFGKLPLLFKILAIDQPLSLQCHPNLEQAKQGWARERYLRESGGEYNYQDDNEKAEIIAALTPITAMCGFRSIDEIKGNLSNIIPMAYKKHLSSFSDVKALFFGIYALNAVEKKDILREAKETVEKTEDSAYIGSFLTSKGIFLKCFKEYPDDIGAIFPYILNVIHLNVGEALYLKPDTLHAYVYGNGVELMSASDNVLRGGLTKKRIDLKELERILDFSSATIGKVPVFSDIAGRKIYQTPVNSFRLVSISKGDYSVDNNSFAFIIVIDESVEIDGGSEIMVLNKGDIALIPKTLKHYNLKSNGQAFMAEVP